MSLISHRAHQTSRAEGKTDQYSAAVDLSLWYVRPWMVRYSRILADKDAVELITSSNAESSSASGFSKCWHSTHIDIGFSSASYSPLLSDANGLRTDRYQHRRPQLRGMAIFQERERREGMRRRRRQEGKPQMLNQNP